MSQPQSLLDVDIRFDAPFEVDRWRVIGNWIIALPHLFILYVISSIASLCWLIAAVALMFTGSVPAGLIDLFAMYHRYNWRVTTFVGFLDNTYPPFEFDMTRMDPGAYAPASFSAPDLQEIPRFAPLYRWILVIPAGIVLAIFAFAVWLVYLVSFFQVLFTGSWSAGMRGFVVKWLRQGTRISAYMFLLTNTSPPILPA